MNTLLCDTLGLADRGSCERVFHFMGRKVKKEMNIQNATVKWAVAKLQGDETASY